MGPNKIKSVQHAVGLGLGDYFLRNGLIKIGRNNGGKGQITNAIKKPDLRKIEYNSEEYFSIMSQSRFSSENDEELEMSVNNDETSPNSCKNCGGVKIHFESGCNTPICNACHEYVGAAGCD